MNHWVNQPCVICGKPVPKMKSTAETGTNWRMHPYPCKEKLDQLRTKTPKIKRKTNYDRFNGFFRIQIDNLKLRIYQ